MFLVERQRTLYHIFYEREEKMAEITLRDGTVVSGKLLFKYVSFEGDTRYIFYVEGRGEVRCVFENYEYKEYVA